MYCSSHQGGAIRINSKWDVGRKSWVDNGWAEGGLRLELSLYLVNDLYCFYTVLSSGKNIILCLV